MPQQLDIFDDSREVTLQNDLAQALLGGDWADASRHADTLQAEFGTSAVLAPAALLIEQGRWRQSLAADVRLEPAAVLAARQRLDGPLAAAALRVLGAQASAAWLAGQWRWLADHAVAVAWQPAHADAHAAGLYLRAGAWPQAVDAVARIASWRRVPVPLCWMAEARWHANGADAAWPLLAEALWLAPARAAAVLLTLADAGLKRLVQRFEAQLDPVATGGADGAHWAWLPAFALVDSPLLAGPLATATPAAESLPGQAFKTMATLLRLERQGRHHEIVAQRAQLRALSPPLFAAYMATR